MNDRWTSSHDDAERRRARVDARPRVMAPKKAPASRPSAKAAVREQREQIKRQLGTIEKTADGRNAVASLFDAALGLDLWLSANKKSFPADAVRQKCERLGEIMRLACAGTLHAEDAYWELAGLYIIVNREASKEELKLERPEFIFPDKMLPALCEDDVISAEDLREILGCELTAEALEAKVLEFEADRARKMEADG